MFVDRHGYSHSCTSTTAPGGHRGRNQAKETQKTPQQDLAPRTSENGISCPCIKVCVFSTYCEKFSKDFRCT